MRFKHTKFREVVYVIQPKDFEYVGNHRKAVSGLSANFRNFMFDTEIAQQTHRWTDEQRILVEQGLMDNQDYGSLLILMEEEGEKLSIPFVAERCVFTVVTDEGPHACGAPVADNSEWYCERHESIVAAAEPDIEEPGRLVHGRASSMT